MAIETPRVCAPQLPQHPQQWINTTGKRCRFNAECCICSTSGPIVVSTIRRIDLSDTPRVVTIAGGNPLDFGNHDGIGDEARFQHPLGFCCWDGQVFWADTYNHAIKIVTPQTREVRSLSDGVLIPITIVSELIMCLGARGSACN